MKKQQDILGNFSEKFPLLNKLYELYAQMPQISKTEENTLRKSSEITVLEILELVVIATRQSKEDKKQTLRQAARKLDTLKVFTDMAKESKNIKEDTYNQIDESLQSIGRMIGGWLKSVSAAKQAS
jgi:four helix bundle protein